MNPKEFYENLEEKKPFTELTSTGISDNLPNVFEFAKMYAEAINDTHCCTSEAEQLSVAWKAIEWVGFTRGEEFTDDDIKEMLNA